ncbi:MAG: ATP synthase F1 subunit epsilon [Sphingomonadales bacterium]
MAELTFDLVTPEKAVLSTTAYMVEIPGSEGDMGILAHHAPVMTTIRDGEIRVYARDGATPQRITVQGGFAEVGDNRLTVLAEHATIVS